MPTKFHIYGDESITGDTVVYALVIVPVDVLEFAEKTLAQVKESFKASRSARFHCREIFHTDARRKSEWSHLTNKQALDLAIKITAGLAGIGIGTIIGHVDSKDFKDGFSGVGELPSMPLQDFKQLIPWAYQAATGQLCFDENYANLSKFWADPDSSLIQWHGSRKQAGRLLKTNKVDISSRTITAMFIPENLHSKEKPALLELADLLAYYSCRVLSNSGIFKNRESDRAIEAIYKSMSPVVHRFRPLDPSQQQEGTFIDYTFN
jgi:hypothetical protein